MEIKSSLTAANGAVYETFWRDIDTLDEVADLEIHGVHAWTFQDGKLVIVYSDEKGYWTPPGGGVEVGESVDEAVCRELLEETNMRVLAKVPIGLFQIFEPHRTTNQVRFMCVAEPVGEFIADPGGDVTEVRSINPDDLPEYFDWGETGAHQLQRARELHERHRQL